MKIIAGICIIELEPSATSLLDAILKTDQTEVWSRSLSFKTEATSFVYEHRLVSRGTVYER